MAVHIRDVISGIVMINGGNLLLTDSALNLNQVDLWAAARTTGDAAVEIHTGILDVSGATGGLTSVQMNDNTVLLGAMADTGDADAFLDHAGVADPGVSASLIDADFSDHLSVMRTLCESYPRMILWGTDSPCYSYICRRKQGEGTVHEFRLKATYADEVAALECLPGELKSRVSGLNTLEFLFGGG